MQLVDKIIEILRFLLFHGSERGQYEVKGRQIKISIFKAIKKDFKKFRIAVINLSHGIEDVYDFTMLTLPHKITICMQFLYVISHFLS